MAYMTGEDWRKFIANRAFNGETKGITMIDYFVKYDRKDGDFYHDCTLLVPFSAWHRGMLERFPVGHKFATVAIDSENIEFHGENGLICKHRIGVHLGPQIQAEERGGAT